MSSEPTDDSVDEPIAAGPPAEGPLQRVLPWLVGVAAMIGCAWLVQLYMVARAESQLQASQRSLAELELRSVRHQLEAERLIAKRQLALLDEEARHALDPTHWQLAFLHGTTPGAAGVVVWNPATRTVLLRCENLPAPVAGEAYTLWLADPALSQPVFAGFAEIDASGAAHLVFRPTAPLGHTLKFTLTRERKDPASPPSTPRGAPAMTGS